MLRTIAKIKTVYVLEWEIELSFLKHEFKIPSLWKTIIKCLWQLLSNNFKNEGSLGLEKHGFKLKKVNCITLNSSLNYWIY